MMNKNRIIEELKFCNTLDGLVITIPPKYEVIHEPYSNSILDGKYETKIIIKER